MDKPLSQERLSEEELKHHIGVIGMKIDFESHESLILLVQEMLAIKSERDQWQKHATDFEEMYKFEHREKNGISRERDRYKAAFDYSVTNIAAYGLKQASAQAMKMLEGVNDHE